MSFSSVRESRKRARELGKRLEEITAAIETAEARVAAIDQAFCEPDYYEKTPPDQVTRTEKERATLQEKVERLMEEWARVEEELETLPGK